MELVRDLDREARNQFLRIGIGISNIKRRPHWVKENMESNLRSGSNYIERDRWQYTIGLCNQVISGGDDGTDS